MFCYKLYLCPQKNSLQTTTTKINVKNCPGKDREGERPPLCPERGLSFPPTPPITTGPGNTHCRKPQAQSHSRAGLLHSWAPLHSGARGQALLSAGWPWTQRGLPRCPRPCFASYAFPSHSTKYSVLGINSVPMLYSNCPCSSPNPETWYPEAHFKAQGAYQSGMFLLPKWKTQNVLSKKSVY